MYEETGEILESMWRQLYVPGVQDIAKHITGLMAVVLGKTRWGNMGVFIAIL